MTAAISQHDLEILRALAQQVVEIAALPEHDLTSERWRRLNDLHSTRPMVRIYQLPWRELDVNR